jgi:soluble lytic murein transglycosylase-like protein
MQISHSVLTEWNEDESHKKWDCAFNKCFNSQHSDPQLFIPEINKQIGTWYLKRIWEHYLPHYKIPQTIDNLLIAYNWGIGNLNKWYKAGADYKKLPTETKNYIKKYHRAMNLKYQSLMKKYYSNYSKRNLMILSLENCLNFA